MQGVVLLLTMLSHVLSCWQEVAVRKVSSKRAAWSLKFFCGLWVARRSAQPHCVALFVLVLLCLAICRKCSFIACRHG